MQIATLAKGQGFTENCVLGTEGMQRGNSLSRACEMVSHQAGDRQAAVGADAGDACCSLVSGKYHLTDFPDVVLEDLKLRA
jgi:hypothetical protein